MGEKTGQKLEGYPLKELKSAETLWRGLYGIEFEDAIYVIEVDFFDFSEKVRLYRDGFLVDEGVSPVVFDLGSGVRIEAAMALFGMKYARRLARKAPDCSLRFLALLKQSGHYLSRIIRT